MLHVILTILKIIGIVLLSILGLIILILCCVLFVPVRYRVTAAKDSEHTDAVVKIHWLLHIVSIKAFLDNKKLRTRLKIFGIPFKDSARKKKPRKQKVRKQKTKKIKKAAVNDSVVPAVNPEISSDATPDELPKTDLELNSEENLEENPTVNSDVNQNTDESTASKDKGLFAKICGIKEKIQYTIHKIYDKIKDILGNIKKYLDILERRETSEAWKLVKYSVFKLLHHIRPRKIRGRVLFGTEDAASTGKILSYVCLLYPIYGDSFDIQADFEEKILEADLYMRGRIRVFTVARIALHLYRDKNVRKVLRMLGK